MTQERKLPTWAKTGLSNRATVVTPADAWQDVKLDKRIREEMGPVITRPIVERIVPRRRGKEPSRDVMLGVNGLSVGRGLRDELGLSGKPRCHVEVDHGEKALRIIIAPDGPWRFPMGTQGVFGGRTLRRELAERGIEPGRRYPARVENGAIVVEFGRSEKRPQK